MLLFEHTNATAVSMEEKVSVKRFSKEARLRFELRCDKTKPGDQVYAFTSASWRLDGAVRLCGDGFPLWVGEVTLSDTRRVSGFPALDRSTDTLRDPTKEDFHGLKYKYVLCRQNDFFGGGAEWESFSGNRVVQSRSSTPVQRDTFSQVEDDDLCCVCMDAPIETARYEETLAGWDVPVRCHLCLCASCRARLCRSNAQGCPLCRAVPTRSLLNQSNKPPRGEFHFLEPESWSGNSSSDSDADGANFNWDSDGSDDETW